MFEFKSPHALPPSRFLSISAAVHGAIGIVLLTLHFAPAVRAMPRAVHLTLLAPIPNVRLSPPRPEPLKAHVVPKPVPALAAVEPTVAVRPIPREFRLPAAAPRPAPAKVQLTAIAAAPIETHILIPQIEMPAIEHAAPRILKTDNFSDAKSTAVATASNNTAKPAGFGSIETASRTTPSRSLSTGGTSFGSATSAAPAPERRIISTAQFGDATIVPASRHREVSAAQLESAVEILFKPRPAYTAEARRLQIEGEVLLEIQFTAGGELRIMRVVRGLGHGLDESAADAARQIRFRPAMRTSVPVDSTAIVHIQFQLAY